MKMQTLVSLSSLAVLGFLASAPSYARPASDIDASADAALSRFYAMSPKHRELAEHAKGVLVFGRVTKAGVGVAGEFGEGELRVGGTTENYYKITAASVGLTLGMGEHSEVILFMTQDALDKFERSRGWAVGVDAAVAVVKSGAAGDYDTATLAKPILGFDFGEKGLLGDLSFQGSKVTKIEATK
jgi:lipid-binding SYLF domain-containing protein